MRRAILKVTPSLLAEIFRNNNELHVRVKSGIPSDAKFIGAQYNSERTCFDICYESIEFLDIPEGELLPVLPPPTITELEV